MVTVIPAGGPGTLGFAISGRLTRAEYQEVLLPPIRETIERGDPLRILAVIDDFQGLEAGALLDDLRAAAKLGSGQRGPAARFAVVTDIEWARRGIGLFGWLVPGEIRVFAGARRAEADTWLSE
jgi:SpoIIAA-like